MGVDLAKDGPVDGWSRVKERETIAQQVIDEVKKVLGETLQLGARVDGFSAETPLFGAIAEFDSMAVVTVVTALEERFDIFVEDDEIEAEVFATIGSLAAFISQKLEA